jgi:hypothetical protein
VMSATPPNGSSKRNPSFANCWMSSG